MTTGSLCSTDISSRVVFIKSIQCLHMLALAYTTRPGNERRRKRRKVICQKGWLTERASAQQRWLPYTQ